jgi:hypothetical protein
MRRVAQRGQQFREMESGLFSPTELDAANHLERADEIRFGPQCILPFVPRQVARTIVRNAR